MTPSSSRQTILYRLRLLFLAVLLGSALLSMAFTIGYLFPPKTDQQVTDFVRSNIYLPEGDLIEKAQLYGPLNKLLAEVRAPFPKLFTLSLINLGSACAYVITLGASRRLNCSCSPEEAQD